VIPLGLLEPGAVKAARRVLRGPRRSNAPGLPDRGLRRPVVLRKNCYGSGAHWSAGLAADAWTILATVAQHGLNPTVWLSAYLDACATAGGRPPPADVLAGLLPWNIDAATQASWMTNDAAPP
jgi:hypothetical protein